MDTYNVVLFIHILGALTLFAAFGLALVGGATLLAARNVERLGTGPAAGGGIADRRFTAIRNAANLADDGPVPTEPARRIADHALWAWLWTLQGIALGIVWLMTVKPGWVGSIVVTIGLSLVGAAIGLARARRVSVP